LSFLDKYKLKEEEKEQPFSFLNKYKTQVAEPSTTMSTTGADTGGATGIGEMFTPEGIASRLKSKTYRTGEKEETFFEGLPETGKKVVQMLGGMQGFKLTEPEIYKQIDDISKKINEQPDQLSRIAKAHELLTGEPIEQSLEEMGKPTLQPWDKSGFTYQPSVGEIEYTKLPEKFNEAQGLAQQATQFSTSGKIGDVMRTVAQDAVLGYMAATGLKALYKSGMTVEGKWISGNKLKSAMERAQKAYISETNKFKSSLSNNDFEIVKAITKIVRTTGVKAGELAGVKVPQEVFMGQAGHITNLVKIIQNAGKITPEVTSQLKALSNIEVSQITQQLLNTSPALASEFLKAIEKPEGIPEPAKVTPPTEPKEVLKAEVKEPWEMTREEFGLKELEQPVVARRNEQRINSIHKALINYAIEKGKPVPPEVLADYPDLKAKPTPAIPAELEGLAEEARKYKSAEEFVETQSEKNRLYEQAQGFKNKDDFIAHYRGSATQYNNYTPGLRKFGTTEDSQRISELGIDPNKKITIYRGIDDIEGKFKNTKISDGDFVTTDFDSAKSYTGGEVISKEVRAKDLITDFPNEFDSKDPFYVGAEFIYSKSSNKLIKYTDSELENIFKEAKSSESVSDNKQALKAEKASKYKELRKEAEARVNVDVKEEIKKGVKQAITGKKYAGLSSKEKIEGNILIGQIHKVANDKGLTGVEFTALKRKYGLSPHLATATKRMTIPQLQEVLKAVNRARPKIVNYKHVITPKTEKKIQSLKDNLIDKLQMTEEAYQQALKDVHVFKEPKYIDAKNFITEKQGKDVIYRLIGESDILRVTLPYEKAVNEKPEIKRLIDKEKATINKYKDKGLKDPKELNSMRVYAQKMGEITGTPVYRMYQDLVNIHLENKLKLARFINEFDDYKDIIKDEKALKRVDDYIVNKSTLKDKPEYPGKITGQEIKLAKKIEGILKDYEAKARTEAFLNNLDHPEDIPQYQEFKKEIDKAKDIYESKGYDDLKEYMKDQKWGVVKSGYSPLQVISPKIRIWKPKPQTFGKSHIKPRTDIEYKEQDRNIIQRLLSYKKQMDNLVSMRPKVRALITLVDSNLDKFQNPKRVEEVIEVFLRELKGYNKPEGLVERNLNRAYAQAMQTIILPSVAMFGRNVLQPIGFGFDKITLIDPRNKKLTTDEKDYLNTYVSQMEVMKVDWFMTGEKPYGGKIGAGLMKAVNKVGIYPYSDQANRHLSFWARVNQVNRAFAGDKSLDRKMKAAKFADMERSERIMALEILAKDGEEAMARYIARVFTDDTQFVYDRSQRSPAEMGRGKWLSNLMLFPRAYNEMLLKQAKHFKEGTPRQKARAFKVLTSVIVGGLLVGAAYQKVTGRRQNPYNPLTLLAYEPGGLAIGTVEAVSDVYVNTIMAVGGDDRAVAALTTAIPRLADMWIPFYAYTTRGYEAVTNTKNIDVKNLRKIRELLNQEYKTRGDAYVLERNAYQKWQYLIAGAGIDVKIKEQQAKKKKEPTSIYLSKYKEQYTTTTNSYLNKYKK